MVGGFNDAVLRLMPGASEPEVLRRIDLIVEPYGGNRREYCRAPALPPLCHRGDPPRLRSWRSSPSAIFLGVAAFLLNIVLARQIASQREQIAALKAFGYRRQIGWHYAQFALLITAFGAAFGSAMKLLHGARDDADVCQFYRFPTAEYRLEPSVIGMAFALSCAAARSASTSSRSAAPPLLPAGGGDTPGRPPAFAPPWSRAPRLAAFLRAIVR
ncbi:MAG: FtsX-like permease family protein [Verrucomicrobiales bacterium]